MKRLIAICSLIALFLLVFSFSALAASYRHPATGLVFPDRLASLKKGEVKNFEKERPGLGISVGYNAPGIAMTIFVYDYGIKDIPRSIDDPAIRRHFEQVVGDVTVLGKRGQYDNLQQLSEKAVVLSPKRKGPKALLATFRYILNGRDTLSRLYLTSYKGHFVKIRYSYDNDRYNNRRADKILRQALDSLARMLAR
jgi:hypothetical protein